MADDAQLSASAPAPDADAQTIAGHPPPPATIAGGRYEFVRFLARGTSKDVYLARDMLLGREVAVGLVTDTRIEGALRTRLLREVRATAQLDAHPHIVSVYDVGEEQGATWIVSQYVGGGTLAELLERHPQGLPMDVAIALARQVADALSFAHDHAVVHRDVKPGNVLLADPGTALLADFGVALLVGQARLTTEAVPLGTPLYMPPEQVGGGAVDARSDLYALGAMLFEMVCGRPPFEGSPMAVIAQQLNAAPPDPRSLRPELPDDVAELILSMLSKRQEDRPSSAAAVRDTLGERNAQVRRRASARFVPPLPAPLVAGPRQSLIDRDEALQSLRACWQRKGDGRAALSVVLGEPGIGKTRLAAAFAQEIHEAGAMVLYGRCDEDALVSYQPFVEALRHLVSQEPTVVAGLDAQWGPELAELAGLVPELRGRVPISASPRSTLDPQRYLLFEAVMALLSVAAAARPVLLVFDDLHWADTSTALLLRHLARADVAASIMVLGTAREPDAATSAPLRGALADIARVADPAQERIVRITLGGLDADETRRLITVRKEREIAVDVARMFQRETDGNPFFIEETLRAVDDQDLGDAQDAAVALRSAGVPVGAKGVIHRRLERLAPTTLALLTRASVCGRAFRLDVLAEMLGDARLDVLAGLEDAISAGLVVEPSIGRCSFCHALVRETLYEGVVSDANRARLHLAAGEALERLEHDRPPVAELALHFHAARQLGAAGKAFQYGLAAADAAAEALAYEEAADHLVKALDALDLLGPGGEVERIEVLFSLGRLRWRAGLREAAQEAFASAAEIARRLGAPEHFARAALGYAGRSYEAETIDPLLEALLREALEAVPAANTSLRAKLMARLGEALHPIDGDLAIELSGEAVAIARESGDEQAILVALAGRHTTLLHSDHLCERLDIGREWLARSEAGGRDILGQALHWHIYDLVELGDLDEAHRAHPRLKTLAERLRQPLYQHFAASWDAKWAEMAGDFAEGEAKAAETYRYGRRAQGGHVRLLYAGHLYGLRRSQGRLAEIRDEVRPLIGDKPTLPVWRAGLIAAYCETGDPVTAQAELDRLTRDGCAHVPRDMFWLGALCLLAEGAVALGDRAAAVGLRRALEPYADHNAQIGMAFLVGPVTGFLAVLAALEGDAPAAAGHFETALRRTAAHGAVTAEALVQSRYGEFLRAQDDPRQRDRAAELLERSRDTARRVGMLGLEAEAAGTLRDAAARGRAGDDRVG